MDIFYQIRSLPFYGDVKNFSVFVSNRCMFINVYIYTDSFLSLEINSPYDEAYEFILTKFWHTIE